MSMAMYAPSGVMRRKGLNKVNVEPQVFGMDAI